MSARRFGRLHKATALVPMALLSAAWTANLLGVNAPIASAGERPDPTLPDGTSVPAQAIEAPASVSDGSLLALGVGNADAQQIVATASTSGIPSAALAAYQRAETIINAADASCHLDWQLIAAIGRVESNHGRANGNTLDDNGLATPGIYGVALNGSNNTTEIVDTDAGQFDNDTAYDRAVGPMQFIPSTWSVVGVDADGDGVRNPQDIDDAALGTAVYLCSGSDDLGTDAGRRAAVYRYNHSQSYVDLVLAIMDAYEQGDFTSIPNGTVLAGELTRTPPPLHVPGAPAAQGPAHITKPPTSHSTDHTVDAPPTDTGHDTSGGGSTGGGSNGGGNRRWWRPRPGHPGLDPAAPDHQRPAGRPGPDPGAGDGPVHARRRQPAEPGGVPDLPRPLHEPEDDRAEAGGRGRQGPAREVLHTAHPGAVGLLRLPRRVRGRHDDPMRVVQVAQRAEDLERATAFYADLLGAPAAATYDPPGLVFFDLAGVRLMLEHNAPSAMLYLGVEDIDATVDRLRASGVTIESEPHVIFSHDDDTLGPAGTDEWQAFVRDTEGNLVGLAELRGS